jgi:hypothetical protein
MNPDDKTLAQFKKLYFEEFGEELSDEEGSERFSRLLSVLKVICFPETSPDLDKLGGYDTVRTEK